MLAHDFDVRILVDRLHEPAKAEIIIGRFGHTLDDDNVTFTAQLIGHVLPEKQAIFPIVRAHERRVRDVRRVIRDAGIVHQQRNARGDDGFVTGINRGARQAADDHGVRLALDQAFDIGKLDTNLACAFGDMAGHVREFRAVGFERLDHVDADRVVHHHLRERQRDRLALAIDSGSDPFIELGHDRVETHVGRVVQDFGRGRIIGRLERQALRVGNSTKYAHPDKTCQWQHRKLIHQHFLLPCAEAICPNIL